MTAADWIRLAFTVAAACFSVWAAISCRRSAQQARENLRRTRHNARQACGAAALMQLNAMKMRNRNRK